MRSAFHFEGLVWDWPIAVYLFLIGVSAGLVMVAIMLRRGLPEAGEPQSPVMRATLWVAPLSVILGLLILIFHLTRPWAFWKLMFHYSLTSVMSMGVMLFQIYMLTLVAWLAVVFRAPLNVQVRRWLPPLLPAVALLERLQRWLRPLEHLMLGLALLLGAYTGFLLSALTSRPMLNHPVLPALFLFSGLSSGLAVAMLAVARERHARTLHWLHSLEMPILAIEIFLLVAFFAGLWLGDDGKVRAFGAALGGGFWSAWFWWGVVGLGFVAPMLARWAIRRRPGLQVAIACGCSLVGVLMLRFYILYAGQMTLA
jgi:protein NrfD